MRRYLIICSLILLSLVAMAQDLQTLSQRDIVGTARYVGMAGAMTAVGGDATAVSDNPAGLGVYRSFEAELTADLQWESKKVYCVPTMASVAFAMPNFRSNVVESNNLMFGFHRVKNFVRDAYASQWTNLQDRVKEAKSVESGFMNVYDIAWAINLRHRLYIGASANIYSWQYNKDFYEWVGPSPTKMDRYRSYNTLSGYGVAASFGLLYRPIEYLRLGWSISTPAIGTLNVSDYDEAGDYTERRRYRNRLPWRTSVGLATQFGPYGILSLQYDYRGYKNQMDGIHTMKVGIEGVAARRWFFNAGYAYESTFRQSVYDLPEHSIYRQDPVLDEKTGEYYYPYTNEYYRSDVDFRYMRNSHVASVGVGYQGNYLICRLAYQWRIQRYDLYPDDPWENIGTEQHPDWVYHGDDMRDMRAITHRVVLTIGWKH